MLLYDVCQHRTPRKMTKFDTKIRFIWKTKKSRMTKLLLIQVSNVLDQKLAAQLLEVSAPVLQLHCPEDGEF